MGPICFRTETPWNPALKILFLLVFFCCVAHSSAADGSTEYTGVIRLAEAADADVVGYRRHELFVFVNEVQVYPRTLRKGTRNFKIGEKFRFHYRPGDQIRVIFCRKNILGREILLNAGSASPDALSELFGKIMKTEKATVELALSVPEGKYRITLKESSFAPEDAVACGGTVKGEDFKRRMADFMIRLQESPPEKRSRMLKEQTFRELADCAAKSLEKLDHRIVVRQNGRLIFDSRARGFRGTGRYVKWKDVSFEIDWRIGDWIEVHFLDADLMDDDVVFKRLTNTPFSIQLLKGTVRGGILSNSSVVFSAEYQE